MTAGPASWYSTLTHCLWLLPLISIQNALHLIQLSNNVPGQTEGDGLSSGFPDTQHGSHGLSSWRLDSAWPSPANTATLKKMDFKIWSSKSDSAVNNWTLNFTLLSFRCIRCRLRTGDLKEAISNNCLGWLSISHKKLWGNGLWRTVRFTCHWSWGHFSKKTACRAWTVRNILRSYTKRSSDTS